MLIDDGQAKEKTVPKMARPRSESSCRPAADSHLIIVPPGAPAWVTPELVQQTITTWQPYYADPLTLDDALAMIINVAALWTLLAEGSDR